MSEGISAAEAGPILCAGITTFNALRNSGARAGDTVAVQGIGGLGHLALQYAARMGFRTVALSRGADKEELARQLGAHEYIDAKVVPAAEALQKIGTAAYQASGSAEGASTNGTGPEDAGESAGSTEDEAVEGEFKEV